MGSCMQVYEKHIVVYERVQAKISLIVVVVVVLRLLVVEVQFCCAIVVVAVVHFGRKMDFVLSECETIETTEPTQTSSIGIFKAIHVCMRKSVCMCVYVI